MSQTSGLSNKTRRIITIVVAIVVLAGIITGVAVGVNRHKNGGEEELSKASSNASAEQSSSTETKSTTESTTESTTSSSTSDATSTTKKTTSASTSVKAGLFTTDATYRAKHDYCIAVNTAQNIVIIYTKDEDGNYTKPYKAMVCSCGIMPNSATKLGTFYTSEKLRWHYLNGGVYGQYCTRISGPYLFHSVPYYTQNAGNLEYDEYNKLGTNASAGCVRLAVKDTKWIYDNCSLGTEVVIYNDASKKEPLAKPSAQKIDTSDTAKRGWDPTDPDPSNPWNN